MNSLIIRSSKVDLASYLHFHRMRSPSLTGLSYKVLLVIVITFSSQVSQVFFDNLLSNCWKSSHPTLNMVGFN